MVRWAQPQTNGKKKRHFWGCIVTGSTVAAPYQCWPALTIRYISKNRQFIVDISGNIVDFWRFLSKFSQNDISSQNIVSITLRYTTNWRHIAIFSSIPVTLLALWTGDVYFPCWWSQRERKRKEEDTQTGGGMKLIFGEDTEEEEEVFEKEVFSTWRRDIQYSRGGKRRRSGGDLEQWSADENERYFKRKWEQSGLGGGQFWGHRDGVNDFSWESYQQAPWSSDHQPHHPRTFMTPSQPPFHRATFNADMPNWTTGPYRHDIPHSFPCCDNPVIASISTIDSSAYHTRFWPYAFANPSPSPFLAGGPFASEISKSEHEDFLKPRFKHCQSPRNSTCFFFLFSLRTWDHLHQKNQKEFTSKAPFLLKKESQQRLGFWWGFLGIFKSGFNRFLVGDPLGLQLTELRMERGRQ